MKLTPSIVESIRDAVGIQHRLWTLSTQPYSQYPLGDGNFATVELACMFVCVCARKVAEAEHLQTSLPLRPHVFEELRKISNGASLLPTTLGDDMGDSNTLAGRICNAYDIAASNDLHTRVPVIETKIHIIEK